MRFGVRLLLLSLFMLGCSSASHDDAVTTSELKHDPKWVSCKVDSDCTRIDGVCGVPAAINRKYVSEMASHYKELAKTYNCKPYENMKFKKSTPIGCENNKCTLVFN